MIKMTKFILKNILPISLLCLSLSAQADDVAGIQNMPGMKEHFLTALKSGTSGGEVKDGIAVFIKHATKSNEPVFVTVTRIQQFERGCGRLHATVKQNIGGAEIAPWFELNICPDGNPPTEKIAEMQAKQQAILKACKVSIEKKAQDKETGATEAMIHATGCATGGVGMTHWKYSGECDELFMPNGLSTNTPVKNGRIDIGLRIPGHCLAKKNEWTAVIESREGQVVGEVKAVW